MNVFSDFWSYVTTADNWNASAGDSAIGHLILTHLEYTVISLAIAAAIAMPLAMVTGHLRRFALTVASIATAGRALPTLGLLYIVASAYPIETPPVIAMLVVLGIPAILVNTYAGITGADADAVDAARGMGMSETAVLLSVETPIALPLIWLGLRNAAFQVISTATIAAFVSLGGLGVLIRFGLATKNYAEVVAGAGLTIILALLSLALFSGLSRLTVSRGVRARS